ncbi:MAG: branched-chain-amino-acid transaminase [Hyphomicrobiaceae bacterium]
MTEPERPPLAMMNGEIVPYDQAKISIMAPGLTFAVLAFEGLRGYWNDDEKEMFVFRAPEHLDRLAFSNSVIEIDDAPDGAAFNRQMLELIRACEMRQDCYIRIQSYIDEWGAMAARAPVGSSIICRARGRVAAFTNGVHFSVSSWRRNEDDASPSRIKASANYLNSRLAGLEAKRSGFDAAVILNRSGTVSEGPGGCIFLMRDGAWITPPVTAGILESVTRQTLIEIAGDIGPAVTARDIGRTELYLAEEAFYCGTGQEIVPILSFDRKAVGNGQPGPQTRRLQDHYDAVVRGRVERYRGWLTPVWGKGAPA